MEVSSHHVHARGIPEADKNNYNNGFKFVVGEAQRSLGEYIAPIKLGKTILC